MRRRLAQSRRSVHRPSAVCVVCVIDSAAAAKWPPTAAAVTVAMLRLFCYVFAYEFLFNPHFNLEPDYIIRRPIVHRILRYIPRGEILSTFHTRVENRSVQ